MLPAILPCSLRPRLWLGVLLAFASLEAASYRAASPVPTTGEREQSEDLVTSRRLECFNLLGAARWQQLGFRGQGTKIAILDSGFRGYRDFLGKELPPHVMTASFRGDRNLEASDSQHGILCGEVIHSLAPEAQLLFTNWEPDDPASFIEAVRWAKRQGARILSCSLIMPNWSDGEGGGQVHAALSQLLGSGQGAADLLFFASAGNTALRHWSGSFDPNPQGFHQWRSGRSVNVLSPWGTDRIAVEVYGPTKAVCELEVCDEATGTSIGHVPLQADRSWNWSQAVMRFDPVPGHDYLVRLRCRAGSFTSADKFHMVALGGNLEDYSSRGSIPFPGDGDSVVAVGAVDGDGKRLSYSSCGPNSTHPKPDFVGLVPFPTQCRSRPFAGTSAAAPEAAALAALCWSRYPGWTPDQIRVALQNAALDLHTPGHDCETGFGLVRLPQE